MSDLNIPDMTTLLTDEQRAAVTFPQDLISICHERAETLREFCPGNLDKYAAEPMDTADLLDMAAGAISALMQSLTVAASIPDRLEADAAKFEEAARRANNGQSITDLHARATSYQACAGLVRQALK